MFSYDKYNINKLPKCYHCTTVKIRLLAISLTRYNTTLMKKEYNEKDTTNCNDANYRA